MSKRVQILFWLSFLYMTVALIFWGRSLYNISVENIGLRKELLQYEYTTDSLQYHQKYNELNDEINTRRNQFLGEGLTFFVFIIISGFIVYISLRKESERNAFQQNVLLSITHELKTPLASAKLALQTLLKRELERDAQIEVLNLAIDDINRLDEMTNNILSINNLENNQLKTNIENSTAQTILSPIIENYSNAQNTHKIILEGEDFSLKSDPYLLSILLSNLINNAIKYSPNQDTIYIRTSQKNEQKIIEIIDLGKGIEKSEQEKVFRKFYRIGDETTRTSKGTGLGLYIVKKISAILGLQIEYDNSDGTSVFKIIFTD